MLLATFLLAAMMTFPVYAQTAEKFDRVSATQAFHDASNFYASYCEAVARRNPDAIDYNARNFKQAANEYRHITGGREVAVEPCRVAIRFEARE